jgi:hypothetical protein
VQAKRDRLLAPCASRHLTAMQAKMMLASVRPRDLPGRIRRELAVELVAEVQALDDKLKQLTRRLRQTVAATGSGLMDLYGIGPAGAARILADVGDVARFADRNRFASWTGTAPLDASSGAQIHHRLSRAGNRRLNHVLHIAAVCQIRHDTPGRAYYRRKLAKGKTPLEALRCLRRRLSDVVYGQLVADAATANQDGQDNQDGQEQAGPGGHSGATLTSSAADGVRRRSRCWKRPRVTSSIASSRTRRSASSDTTALTWTRRARRLRRRSRPRPAFLLASVIGSRSARTSSRDTGRAPGPCRSSRTCAALNMSRPRLCVTHQSPRPRSR